MKLKAHALIARIRLRRATRPSTRTIPKQAHPLGLEREYARTLIGMMTHMKVEIAAAILPMFPPGDDRKHTDAPVASQEVFTRMNRVRVQLEARYTAKAAGLVAQGYGLRTEKFNKVAMGDQLRAVMGVDPLTHLVEPATPGIMDQFTAENVQLIQSIPERYFSELHAVVSDSVSVGRRSEHVAELLEARYDVSVSRAALIARDQISKLNGKLTESRQSALGIKGYRWRTSNDERVRDTHAALEGASFTWDSPPSIGHPGEDFQCRCRAEPDLSAIFS